MVAMTRHLFRRPDDETQRAFHKTFGVAYATFEGSFGFDVVRFDAWLKPGDRSTLDVIKERYGEDAVTLVLKLVESERGGTAPPGKRD